jgi:hypothetical protein
MAYQDMINKLAKKSEETFTKPQSPEVVDLMKSFEKAESTIGDMNATLSSLPGQAPVDTAKKIAELNDLQTKLQELGKKQSTAKALTGQSPFGSDSLFGAIGTTTEATTLQAARGAGKAVKATRDITKHINEMTPEVMKGLASSLAEKGSPYAKQLAALIDKPDQSKRALLFTLSQQPGFRQEVRKFAGIEED